MIEDLEVNKNLLREKMLAYQGVKNQLKLMEEDKETELSQHKKQKQKIDRELAYLSKTFDSIALEMEREIDELNLSILHKKNEILADELIQIGAASNNRPQKNNGANEALATLLAEFSELTETLRLEQEAYAQEYAALKTQSEKLVEIESAIILNYNEKINPLKLAAEKLDDEVELLYQELSRDSVTDSVSNILKEFTESEGLSLSRSANIVDDGMDNVDEDEPLVLALPRIHDGVESYLRHLDLDISDLLNIATSQPLPQLSNAGLHEGLLHILKAETSRLSYLRWANLETLPIKLMQGRVSYIDLTSGDVNLQNFANDEAIFPSGRALPVEKNATRRMRQITAAIVEGAEHSMMSLLHMTLYSVLVYQLLLPYLNHGGYSVDGLKHIFSSYEEIGTDSIVRLLAKMQPEMTSTVIIGFIVASIFILAARQAIPAWECDNKKADGLIDQLDKISFGLIRSNVSFLFPYRWLPPFSLIPYLNFESKFLLSEHCILHQSGITPEKRLKIWSKLKDIALTRNKLVRREAMHTIANIAHGIALKDFVWLYDKGYTSKELSTHLYIKIEAFGVLHYLASHYQLDNKTGLLNQYVYPFSRYLYANYLLWWLNDSNRLFKHPHLSPLSGLMFLVFKIGKLILQAKLFEIIIKSVVKAIQCPDLPFVQFGKEIPVFANRLDIECFKAVVKLFRALPGQERQPVSFITDIVSQFDFWVRDSKGDKIRPGLTELDLSGKYLRAYEAAAILNALAYKANDNMWQGNGIDLVAINLDAQYLHCYNQEVNCSFWFGASSLVKSFRAWPNLKKLSMANNPTNGYANITSSIQDFGKGLQYISSIIHFNASESSVGLDSAGVLLWNLGFLTNLRSLDLSTNEFVNIKPLGESLVKLSNLQKLVLTDLSGNNFYGSQYEQYRALNNGLRKLYQLTHLDLSLSSVSGNASLFEQIGLSLRKLTALETLNLARFAGGAKEGSSFTNIVTAVGFMPYLKTLYLNYNYIGRNASQVIAGLALSLGKCKHLGYINIEHNSLGFIDNSSFSNFINQLATLPSLYVDMSNNDLNTSYALHIIKTIAPHRFTESFNFLGWDIHSGYQLTPAIISAYLARLPVNTTQLFPDPNALFYIRTSENLIALANGLSRLRHLLFLGVVNDQPAYGTFSGNAIKIFYSKLKSLRQLSFLALSAISSDNDTLSQTALGNGLSLFHELKTLGIANMAVWSAESNAITHGLCQLSSLEELGLIETRLFLDSPNSSASLAQSFPCLTNLRKLDLSENSDFDVVINRTSVNIYLDSSFGENLRYLTKLENLNLEDNFLGYSPASNFQSLLVNLRHLTMLKSVMLGNNFLEADGVVLTEALGNSIGTLVDLVNLELYGNLLGNISYEGVELLGRNLQYLRSVQLVDLSSNYIGLHGTGGIDAISFSAEILPSNVTIRLGGNSNITSQVSNILAQQKYKSVNQSCNDRVCHANQFHQSKQGSIASSPSTRLYSLHLLDGIGRTPYVNTGQIAQQYLITGLYLYALLKHLNISSTKAVGIATLFMMMQYLDFPVAISGLVSGSFFSIFNMMNLRVDREIEQVIVIDAINDIDAPKKCGEPANGNYLSKYGVFSQRDGSRMVDSVADPQYSNEIRMSHQQS